MSDNEKNETNETEETEETEESQKTDNGSNESSEKTKKMHYCYIIFIFDAFGSTYNGYTVNREIRIRQHNGEIKGGARFTARKRARTGSPHHW